MRPHQQQEHVPRRHQVNLGKRKAVLSGLHDEALSQLSFGAWVRLIHLLKIVQTTRNGHALGSLYFFDCKQILVTRYSNDT